MNNKLYRLAGIALAIFLLCSGAVRALADDGSPVQVQATITGLQIQSVTGETATSMFVSDTFHLAMDWDASSHGPTLHGGDYFDITLPGNMMFPPDTTASDFDVLGDDGSTTVARAHVTPGAGGAGGTVRVTFTDWVEGKTDVRGSLWLASRFDETQVTVGESNVFDVTVDGKVTHLIFGVTGPAEHPDRVLSKYGEKADGNTGQALWKVRINHSEATLTNVVISDQLYEGDGTETYVADSFALYRVDMDAMGSISQIHEQIDLTGKLEIAPDGRSFTLDLGDIGQNQYRLEYRTTYVPGSTLRNSTTLNATERTDSYSAAYTAASSGGSGTGSHADTPTPDEPPSPEEPPAQPPTPATDEPTPSQPQEAKPHTSVPKAGDDTNLLPLAALAVSGVAAIGVALVVRRRRD